MNQSDRGKGRILVVDDDRLVLATLVHGLTQAGYEVFDADNGDDAILLARQHRPDLALLDIRMEGKTGFDVAAYLREYLHTPFMFLSAFSDEETVQQVQALGAVASLVKPLDIGQILPTVAAAMARTAAGLAGAAGQPARPAGGPARALSPEDGRPAATPAATPAAIPAAALAAASPAATAGTAATATHSAALDGISLAVGVLMHRYSLPREAAWQRLQRMAHDGAVSLPEQARRLVDAVELLASGGQGG